MHMSRQEADVRAFMEDESLLLDPKLDYSTVPGLSSEVIEKLYIVRPTTIVSYYNYILRSSDFMMVKGAAKRMESMTPTSVISLLKHAKRTWGHGAQTLAS